MVAKPGCEERVIAICKKWELEAAIIGSVTDTGRWVVRATPGYDPLAPEPVACDPQIACNLPVDVLTDAAPKYDRPQRDDASLPARLAFDASTIPDPASWSEELLRMAGSPNLGSRRWIYRQYDHIVRGGTVVKPGSDAAVVRVPCEKDGHTIEKFLAFSADCNGRLCELDPFNGAAQGVAEVCRNLACAGAEPIGITDCLNFGSPERPEIMRQIARAIDGMAAACDALAVPIVSGNVSLYNETDGRAILPTPTVAAVGLVRDPGDVTRMAFPEAGLSVILLGPSEGGDLGGSEYVASKTGEVKGRPPALDLDAEKRLHALLLDLCRARPKLVRSAHDISDGGLAIALAECAAGADDPRDMIGASVDLPSDEANSRALFGEAMGRVIVTAKVADVPRIVEAAIRHGVTARAIGLTVRDKLSICRGDQVIAEVSLTALRDARERCLDAITGG